MSWSRHWFMWRVRYLLREFKAWRDVDHERRAYGLTIGRSGLQLDIGRRTYRVYWGEPW